MRLDKLVVHGVLAFKHVEVDFAALPAGIVAIVGANGSGKTSLMDCAMASLYRRFASRPGSLYDYAHGRDSYIEAVWTVGGSAIKTRINLDVVARRSEAVAALDGAALTDGKSSTFDAFIGQTFPSFDLILATAYAAQSGNGSFRSRDQQARKDLFVELIGADKYDAIAAVARDRAGRLAEADVRCRADVAALESLPHFANHDEHRKLLNGLRFARKQEAEALAQANLAIAEISRHDQKIEARRLALTKAEKELASAASEADALRSRVKLAESEHEHATDAEASGRRLHNEAFARIDDDRHVKEDHNDTLRTAEGQRHNGAVRQLDESLTSAAEMIERRDEIDRAVVEVVRIDTKIAKDEAETAELREHIDALRATLVEARQLKRQVGIIDTVPCGAVGKYAECAFLTDAVAAKKELGGKVDVTNIELALTDNRAKLSASLAASIEMRTQKEDVHGPVASLLPMLEDAERRVAEGKGKSQALARSRAGRMHDLDVSLDAVVCEHRQQLAAEERAWNFDRTGHEQRVAETQAELKSARLERDGCLPHLNVDTLTAQRQFASDDYQDALRDAGGAKSTLKEWDETAKKTHAIVSELDADITARVKTTENIGHAARALGGVVKDRSSCSQIANIFGRSGLPLLEIDAAGPAVSDLINRMLSASFGGRFTVNLVTQKPKRSGEGMRDVFDLSVFDGADERAIADLSGGEQVVVDEAVKAALALYSSQRSGTSGPTTCWRDETTGALDGQNLDRYIAMLRTLRDLGGFERVVFVTHSQDAANSADAILRVADGAVTVSPC